MTTPTETKPAIVSPGQHLAAQLPKWSSRDAELLANVIARDLSETDMRVYARICGHTGLDPFKRQIYAWKDGGRMTIHIAVGGWRAIAARSGNYAGLTPPEWCGPDGVWKEFWAEEAPPTAARVGARIKGVEAPTYAVVTWNEFGKPKFDRMLSSGKPASPVWHEKPAHMLAIRAEAHALQKAFPEAFDGAMNVISESKAILDVGDASEMPALPEGLDTETGEIRDVTPVDPQGGVQGEGAPPAPSAPDEGDGNSSSIAPAGGKEGEGVSTASAAKTDTPSPSATQGGLLDSDAKPTAMRTLTDEEWAAMGAEMNERGVTAADMKPVLEKPFSSDNVKAVMRERDVTWQQLVDQAVVRKGAAARQS